MVEVQLDLTVLDVASGPLAAFPGTFKFEEADSDEGSDTNNLSEEQKKKLQPKLPKRVLLSCFLPPTVPGLVGTVARCNGMFLRCSYGLCLVRIRMDGLGD